MSREFPDSVNPWKAAEGNRIYRGSIALNKMARLKPLLAQAEGEAKFEAQFARDGLGFTTVSLKVTAGLPLVCQASLEQYLHPVERRSLLAVIEDMGEQEDLPGHYEATLVEAGILVFLELVQDELILAVPQVPRRPGLGVVSFTTSPDEEEDTGLATRTRPFAALADLMRNEHEDSETE